MPVCLFAAISLIQGVMAVCARQSVQRAFTFTIFAPLGTGGQGLAGVGVRETIQRSALRAQKTARCSLCALLTQRKTAQFVALRDALMADAKYREIVQTIEFPPKKYFGQLKESTVEERKRICTKWLSVRVAVAIHDMLVYMVLFASHVCARRP